MTEGGHGCDGLVEGGRVVVVGPESLAILRVVGPVEGLLCAIVDYRDAL